MGNRFWANSRMRPRPKQVSGCGVIRNVFSGYNVGLAANDIWPRSSVRKYPLIFLGFAGVSNVIGDMAKQVLLESGVILEQGDSCCLVGLA